MSEVSVLSARELLALVMRLAYSRGLINIKGGNASIREGNGFWITPSQIPKNMLRPEDMVYVGLDGEWKKGIKPSMEYRMHLMIYREFRDVNAIIHTHNPYTLALYESGLSLDPTKYIEAYSIGGCIAVVPKLPAGSEELAKGVADAIRKCKVAVLLGHGAVAISKGDIFSALDALEALEDISKVELFKVLLSSRRCLRNI
ncbi:MAG: class II aldolase/adducin family protein [Desulfurococcales archaeon]|nr:class II aldolase/adducin family protein [Desulfurococcales archaeon]